MKDYHWERNGDKVILCRQFIRPITYIRESLELTINNIKIGSGYFNEEARQKHLQVYLEGLALLSGGQPLK